MGKQARSFALASVLGAASIGIWQVQVQAARDPGVWWWPHNWVVIPAVLAASALWLLIAGLRASDEESQQGQSDVTVKFKAGDVHGDLQQSYGDIYNVSNVDKGALFETVSAAIASSLPALLEEYVRERLRATPSETDQQSPLITLSAGSLLTKVHDSHRKATYAPPAKFGHRFKDVSSEYSGLYFADSCQGAVSSFRGRFKHLPVGIEDVDLDGFSYSEMSPTMDLQLFDLASPGAAMALGLPWHQIAWDEEWAAAQETATRVRDTYPSVHGICWPSRWNTLSRFIVMFADRMPDRVLKISRSMPVVKAPCFEAIRHKV